MVQELLTEKLRPKELKFLILPERIRRQFNDGLQQNVLLSGSPGCGKTSTAKILAKDHPTLFINVSDESSVDVVREKINNFCMMSSVMGGKAATKIVYPGSRLIQDNDVRRYYGVTFIFCFIRSPKSKITSIAFTTFWNNGINAARNKSSIVTHFKHTF